MAISSKHPEYSERSTDWQTMNDTYEGERTIKAARFTYLPATPGQEARGITNATDAGTKAYNAYLIRAVFPDFVKQAVETMIGIMHHKPAVIELPELLEPMRKNATSKCESLDLLLRRINEQQLVTGRFGMLLDVVDGAAKGVLPYIATYIATSINNWDDGASDELTKQNLNLVVLEETEPERQSDFEWQDETKYRVLVLGALDTNEPQNEGTYKVGVFRDDKTSFNESELKTPSIAGKTLDQIPFVFVNSKDITPETDAPPLLGLASLALTVYRGEADYRQGLFMQGQDTLVVTGGTLDTYEIGAGAHINVPEGGKAEFIGVSSKGLSEMRTALENDRKDAADVGGRLLDNQGEDEASGKALGIRVSARTASVKQIALTGAAALEAILRMAAIWVGADPDEVKVEPNLDFVDEELSGQTLLEFAQAKVLGAPISQESIHALMKKKGLTEMDFEAELAKIEEEGPMITGLGAEGGEEPDLSVSE